MEKQYHSIFKQIGKNRFYTACNATCSGRIQNGTEFFCGDGVVQKKSGDTSGCGTNGANCVEVTSEYPGPGWTGDASTFTSEACDSDTDTNKLCNLAKGTNRSDYYENSNITCSDSCTIVNADQCGYCGDNKRQSNETCDKDSSGNIITAAGTYGKTCNNETITSSKTWKAPATGKYKIEVYGAQGGSGNGETGGKGAKVWGTFELTKGNSLYIKVGAKGEDHGSLTGGNGGGGSAVSLGNISSIDA
ncbi:hypothetical protein IKO70_03930, partial [bacterium]|nr:hypothetical protein [bacterium]